MLLERVIIPPRLALITRGGGTIAYEPSANVWHLLRDDDAPVLRWLRAGRPRSALVTHLSSLRSVSCNSAEDSIEQTLRWCLIRRLVWVQKPKDGDEPTAPSLSAVYWITTQACNLSCSYCYQDAHKRRKNELTTEEASNLIRDAKQVGAGTFVFTGGEPFTRKDVLPLARQAKALGLKATVITNGSYIDECSIDEVQASFDNVTISLDHIKPEHHDRNRGSGSWQRAVTAIRLLVARGVSVDVNSVLGRDSLADVGELTQLKHHLGLKQHRIMPQFPIGRGVENTSALLPSELLALGDQIQHATLAHRMGQPTLEGRYTDKGEVRTHCGAGLSEVSVDPEGWLYPCRLLQHESLRIGSIRERSLAELYADRALAAIRHNTTSAMRPCSSCVIKNECGGGCRGFHFARTGRYDGSDPLFCAFLRRSFESRMWTDVGVDVPRRGYEFWDQVSPTQLVKLRKKGVST